MNIFVNLSIGNLWFLLFSWNSTDLKPYQKELIHCEIGILSIFGLSVILWIGLQCGVTSKYRRCQNCINLVVTLLMAFVWILCAVQFAVSIEISDGCTDPTRTILDVINVTTEMDEPTMAIPEYYLQCKSTDQDVANPFLELINIAILKLMSIEKPVQIIMKNKEVCRYEEMADVLYREYNFSLNHLAKVNEVSSVLFWQSGKYQKCWKWCRDVRCCKILSKVTKLVKMSSI